MITGREAELLIDSKPGDVFSLNGSRYKAVGGSGAFEKDRNSPSESLVLKMDGEDGRLRALVLTRHSDLGRCSAFVYDGSGGFNVVNVVKISEKTAEHSRQSGFAGARKDVPAGEGAYDAE